MPACPSCGVIEATERQAVPSAEHLQTRESESSFWGSIKEFLDPRDDWIGITVLIVIALPCLLVALYLTGYW